MILQRTARMLMLAATITASVAIEADNKPPGDIKQMQGINIVGDKEAPKSLYIVPWQTTQHEQNTSLSSNVADSSMQALDRESLQRQLQLYELGKAGWHRITADRP